MRGCLEVTIITRVRGRLDRLVNDGRLYLKIRSGSWHCHLQLGFWLVKGQLEFDKCIPIKLSNEEGTFSKKAFAEFYFKKAA